MNLFNSPVSEQTVSEYQCQTIHYDSEGLETLQHNAEPPFTDHRSAVCSSPGRVGQKGSGARKISAGENSSDSKFPRQGPIARGVKVLLEIRHPRGIEKLSRKMKIVSY